jgi:hypothetical protein
MGVKPNLTKFEAIDAATASLLIVQAVANW